MRALELNVQDRLVSTVFSSKPGPEVAVSCDIHTSIILLWDFALIVKYLLDYFCAFFVPFTSL